MEKLAERVKNAICDSNPDLTMEQAETIKFGLECALNEASKIVAYFIIFSIFSLTDHYLIALLFFCSLRVFAGGFHAETYLACFMVTFSIMTVAILTGSQIGLPIVVRVLLLLTSIILASIFAPVDHPNKPMISLERRKRFKCLSIAVFIILAGLTFTLKAGLAATAVMIIFLEALSLPAGEIKKRRLLHEDTED